MGMGSKISKAQARPRVFSLPLACGSDVKLSATASVPCPCHDGHELTCETVCKPPIKLSDVFFSKLLWL